jgi:PAS domain-containing protein
MVLIPKNANSLQSRRSESPNLVAVYWHALKPVLLAVSFVISRSSVRIRRVAPRKSGQINVFSETSADLAPPVHPQGLEKLVETWRAVLASGEPGEKDARLGRFDGEYRRFLFRAEPFRDEHGTVVRWSGKRSRNLSECGEISEEEMGG